MNRAARREAYRLKAEETAKARATEKVARAARLLSASMGRLSDGDLARAATEAARARTALDNAFSRMRGKTPRQCANSVLREMEHEYARLNPVRPATVVVRYGTMGARVRAGARGTVGVNRVYPREIPAKPAKERDHDLDKKAMARFQERRSI